VSRDALRWHGAVLEGDGSALFRVWAPWAPSLRLHLLDPIERELPLVARGAGHFEVRVPDIPAGARYFYRMPHGALRPDPASRFQPEGVHGPSAVVSHDFAWTDASWRGRPWEAYVIYEAHVGTFTPSGTFAAMTEHLDELVRLGITALELMPVAQFPGERNWGYDGVGLYAPQNSYGGPDGLKTLVDACHARGLAVVLDVVYNHVGPEGNYLPEFGPYFTDRYHTPWGKAINYDGPDSRPVRDFVVLNAAYWIDEFHIDALRLDATHAIVDRSGEHVLAEIAEAVRAVGERSGRHVFTIAENNSNNPQITAPRQAGGFGLNAQHVDDFERAVHAMLTPERIAWYSDFGDIGSVAKAYQSAFVITGGYSQYRRQRWGAHAEGVPADRFVTFAQNHDTVGNRPRGERLGRLTDFERLKLAAAITILAPSIPMLFMGEEYDEPAAFYYFTSHSDAELGRAVRSGRRREQRFHQWPQAGPDPQRWETFDRSKLARGLAREGHHAVLWRFYRELLRLRASWAAVRQPDRAAASVQVLPGEQTMIARRERDGTAILAVFHFGAEKSAGITLPMDCNWKLLADSAASEWQFLGKPAAAADFDGQRLLMAPHSCVLLGATS
jgi:maltooligosyltrehalose trehalohydrolase